MIPVYLQPSPAHSRRGSNAEANKNPVPTIPPELIAAADEMPSRPLFTRTTKSIIWGMQQRAVQGMLDFDYVCSRKEPSVVAMIYPFT